MFFVRMGGKKKHQQTFKSQAFVGSKRGGRNKQDISDIPTIYTFPETNIGPENRPGPKRKRSYSNHPFSGANC